MEQVMLQAHEMFSPVCASPLAHNYYSVFSLETFTADHVPLTCSSHTRSLAWERELHGHTPSITFWHLPPNSARFGYATEGALFIPGKAVTDTVSALQKVWVLIRLWEQSSAQARM